MVRHHDIEAHLAPDAAELRVVDTARWSFEAGSDPQAPLRFLLNRALSVESVTLAGQSLAHETRTRWQPRDYWPRPDFERLAELAPLHEIQVEAPPAGWTDAAELTIRYAGAILDSLKAPKVAYARGFETTTGQITSRGAYLASTTFWLPWSSEDRFTFELTSVLPAGWHSVSQGERTRHEVDAEGRSVSTWRESHPMQEAYLIAAPYVVREQRHGDVKLYTYTFENTPADLCQTYLDAAGRYLDLYEPMFGDYPFAKFALAESWWQSGYGMPSFTFLGDRVIRLPFIVDTSYGHEILHNWWGNGVYIDAESGNWCEGLTTYGADYLYKERESEAAARDYRLNQLVAYRDHAARGGRDFALRAFRERSDFATQAVGYGKTMMVFHMLRQTLGDQAFQAGLRRVFAQHQFLPTGWDDLREAFSEVAGEDLTPWFAQWIDRAGAPQLTLGEVEVQDDAVHVTLAQKAPFYSLEVPVTYTTGSGRQSKSVGLFEGSTRFALPADTREVAIDPQVHLFRLLHRAEIPPTLSQTLGADSTLVVIGDRCPPELAQALRTQGEQWSENQDMKVIDEPDVTDADAAGRCVYLLGPGAWSDRALAASTAFGAAPAELVERAGRETLSVVICVRNPDDPELAWTVVLPDAAERVPALGRKLPHYGRYSYLLFAGEDNVDKGAWTVQSSPLRWTRPEAGR